VLPLGEWEGTMTPRRTTMRPVAILIALLAGPALAQAADVQLGVEVQAITEDLRGHFGAPPGVGLLV